MSAVFHAVLGNPHHPECGVATVPFPIPAEEYDHVIEMMEALEIGSPTSLDCQVYEIDGNFPVLKRMENRSVNLDEIWTIWPSGWIAFVIPRRHSSRRWRTSWKLSQPRTSST